LSVVVWLPSSRAKCAMHVLVLGLGCTKSSPYCNWVIHKPHQSVDCLLPWVSAHTMWILQTFLLLLCGWWLHLSET
jgi:hypothetical protein